MSKSQAPTIMKPKIETASMPSFNMQMWSFEWKQMAYIASDEKNAPT
jgi:hypothetical protein